MPRWVVPLAAWLALALAGCTLQSPSLADARIVVSYANLTIAGYQGGRTHTVRGTELVTEELVRGPDGPRVQQSRTRQLSPAQRAEVEELVRRAIGEGESPSPCTDSPSAGLKVTWPDGTERSRTVTLCGGASDGSAVAGLLDYLNRV